MNERAGMVRILRAAVVMMAAAGAAACFGERAPAGGDRGGERRAALARLVVDNRTPVHLSVAFLYATEAGGTGGEVGIGSAAAGTRTELAPVPAAEPIILIARGGGLERRLEPRTLEIDQVWTWVIEQDGAERDGAERDGSGSRRKRIDP